MVELRENAYAKLSETLDEFTEDINEQKDAVSSSINVLNNYKNVIDTLGKKNLGLTSDTLKSIADVQLVAAKGNVDISKSSMESIKNTLDELFRSFEIVTEGTYVYVCDMKYDHSKWSAEAVQYFDLPGEYMYQAGDIRKL